MVIVLDKSFTDSKNGFLISLPDKVEVSDLDLRLFAKSLIEAYEAYKNEVH